jgi:hypothetical protein
MARPNLTALLDSKPEAATRAPKPQADVAVEPASAVSAPAIISAPAAAPTSTAPPKRKPVRAARTAAPERFDQFIRKESRLREDQIDELAAIAKRIMRNRTEGGPRITDNTIIRIAVDLLLSRADELNGNSEDELRASLLGK